MIRGEFISPRLSVPWWLAGLAALLCVLACPGQALAQNSIVGAEYFVGSDPGEGNGTALSAEDGAYDSVSESVDLSGIDVSALEAGYHQVGIR